VSSSPDRRRSLTVTGLTAVAVLAVAASPAAATARPVHSPTTGTAQATATAASVITNAPTAIRLGAAKQTIPVVVRSSFTGTYAAAKLVDPYTGPRFGAAVTTQATRWALYVPITGTSVNRYGAWQWDVKVLDQAAVAHTISVNTVLKANSLLGLSATSTGEPGVTLTVALRAWNNTVARYQGWPGQGVYIQKQAPNGDWVNVGAVTSDPRGNAVKTLGTRSGVYRVYDHDTTTTWGATSHAVRVTAPTTPAPPRNPGDTVNCSDFTTWRAAQDYYQKYFPYYGDIAKLDADHDGITCETLPGAP